MVTDVVFKKFKDGDVIAIFPNLKWDDKFITSYMSVGQHSGCSSALINELKNATPNEYNKLFNELTKNVGYDLRII